MDRSFRKLGTSGGISAVIDGPLAISNGYFYGVFGWSKDLVVIQLDIWVQLFRTLRAYIVAEVGL